MGVGVVREDRPEGGFVARVTIDRAAKLNALDRALIAEIIEAMTALAADPDLRLAVVTGAGGRAFVGGATSTSWPGSTPRAPGTLLPPSTSAATRTAIYRLR